MLQMVTERYRPRDELAFVDAAMERWARWNLGERGAGYTLLAKVIECGFTGAAQRGACALVGDMPEDVQLTERGLLSLKLTERKVLIRRYLRWEPRECAARALHMSPGRFSTVLHHARRNLGYFLSGAAT